MADLSIQETKVGPSVPPVEIRSIERLIERSFRQNATKAYNLGLWERQPEHIFFLLDQRIDWAPHKELTDFALSTLRDPDQAQRNPESYQWLVYSSGHRNFIVNSHTPMGRDAISVADATDLMKSFALERMIEDEGVFFHHRGDALFRLPSGDLSDFFLRVGNVQTDEDNMRTIAFWSLPYLKEVTHIMAETWSISTTAAYLAQFSSQYSSAQMTVTWSFLSQYLPGSSTDLASLKSRLVETVEQNGRLLFLMSASGSGRLTQEVRKVIDDLGISERHAQILTLFSLSGDDWSENVIQSLGPLLRRHRLIGRQTEDTASSKAIISINPKTYFPDYRLVTRTRFSAIRHPAESRLFFHKYAGSGIFCIGRRGRTSRESPDRYHTFYVDFSRLLVHPAFASATKRALRNIGKIDYIVVKNVGMNYAFLELVLEWYTYLQDNMPVIFRCDDYTQAFEDAEISSALSGAKYSVTFVDSVVVTGRSVEDFEILVRKSMDSGTPVIAKLRYLVGLFRPYSLTKVRYGKDYVSRAHNHPDFNCQVVCAEQVILPNWNDDDCPWQREAKAHERAINPDVYQHSDHEKDYIGERLSMLAGSSSDGIKGDALFFKRYKGDNLPFYSGSLFMDVNRVKRVNRSYGIELKDSDIDPADLLCAVASAIQNWRVENDKGRLEFQKIQFDVSIGNETVAENNGFNEPLLRACIWRSIRPSEIDYKNRDSDLIPMLEQVFFDRRPENIHSALGGEAALIFAERIWHILGEQRVAEIDWKYLSVLAEECGQLDRG